jgi:hypothetical protein
MADADLAVAQTSQNTFINNEVLCSVQFFYSQLPKSDLTSILSEFYTHDEISAAKSVLFSSAKGACPPQVTRRGTNKRLTDMDDTTSLFALLDAKKVVLPTFTAVNLSRIPTTLACSPSVTASSTNPAVAALEASVQNIQKQMGVVLAKLDSMASSSSLRPSTCPSMVTASSIASGVYLGRSGFKFVAFGGTISAISGAGAKLAYGKRPSSDIVKVVPRMRSCFAGRLYINTSIEDLQGYLADAGIPNARCRRLAPKNGMQFTTAAFHVSCSSECRQFFYDESSWPEGSELRDWYYLAGFYVSGRGYSISRWRLK